MKPLPPIWIREKQAAAGRMPDQVYREKPRILDCVPEAIIKIDGKVHPAPTRQVIVERMPKLEAKPGFTLLNCDKIKQRQMFLFSKFLFFLR